MRDCAENLVLLAVGWRGQVQRKRHCWGPRQSCTSNAAKVGQGCRRSPISDVQRVGFDAHRRSGLVANVKLNGRGPRKRETEKRPHGRTLVELYVELDETRTPDPMMRNIGTQYLPVIAGFRSSPSTTLYRGLGDGPDGGVNAFGQSTARRAADLAVTVHLPWVRQGAGRVAGGSPLRAYPTVFVMKPHASIFRRRQVSMTLRMGRISARPFLGSRSEADPPCDDRMPECCLDIVVGGRQIGSLAHLIRKGIALIEGY